MTDEMKPCPFCGSDVIDVFPPTCNPSSPYDPADRAYPIARCHDCLAQVGGTNWDRSCESVRAKWNQRTEWEG